ncbi:C_GCAxxG_C_C family protein [Candidatus Bathyarchaeota archaeon]|nr:C_GCAxxG_C_C family protein [Candidatus Bathyarchaeota archaeon]MBS7631460.1 C_GCAxxG_C_C family protein [Candidatus Bathyarchaeota archaeon]
MPKKTFKQKMINIGELRFNCAESTLIGVNDLYKLPGFGPSVLRIASNFGGGVAGFGNICGAISAGMMALALVYGTDGTEQKGEFDEKRKKLRSISQSLLSDFEQEFGSLNCTNLLGVDRRTEEGLKLYAEKKSRGEFLCDRYVDWTVSKVLDLLSGKS